MITPYSGHDFAEALSLIDRLCVADDERELNALAIRVDAWLAIDDPIPLPDGGSFSEPGRRLARLGENSVWLLRGGRLLTVPATIDAQPVEHVISDTDARLDLLAEHLRTVALSEYLNEGFQDLPAPTVPIVVRDLVVLVSELLLDSRVFVLRSLNQGMRPGEGWDTAYARLRAGFERGLADRDPEAVGISAAGLVRLAAGLGPAPPAGDPRRGVVVLFVSPRTEVRKAALMAMDGLPREALTGLAGVCGDDLDACLADADPEIRRLAGSVLRRLHAGGELSEVADTIESTDPESRRAVLLGMRGQPDDRVALLLGPATLALTDDDALVREAADTALRAAAERPTIWPQLVLGLITADQEAAVGLGMALIEASPDPADDALAAGLQSVVDGPWADARSRAAELLADRLAQDAPEDTLEGYEALLRNADPEVRRVALRRIARDAADRVQVREMLFPALAEHLNDPHPELRVEAALTVVELRYPSAATLATQLAYDRDPVVRNSVAHVVARSGDATAHDEAARLVGLVDTLFDFASSGTGDDRVRWKAALDTLTEKPSARTPELLVGLLADAPEDHTDSFVQFAFEEIDVRLLGLLPEGDALVLLCRRLVQPPDRQVKHAARLAGARAAHDPLALDFLWTLYVVGERSDREAARHALASIAAVDKSAAVEAALADLARESAVPAERDLLQTLREGKAGT